MASQRKGRNLTITRRLLSKDIYELKEPFIIYAKREIEKKRVIPLKPKYFKF